MLVRLLMVAVILSGFVLVGCSGDSESNYAGPTAKFSGNAPPPSAKKGAADLKAEP